MVQKSIFFNSNSSSTGSVKYTDEKLREYKTDNHNKPKIGDDSISIGKLNFYIGKNNSGKSRFIRALFNSHLLAWKDSNKEIKFIGTNCDNYPYMPKGEKESGLPLNSVYIPILRGLRPLIENGCAYLNRTQKDYFYNFREGFREEINEYKRQKFCLKEIYTGEDFIKELKEMLRHTASNQQKHQQFQEYIKKISQYFFDNIEIHCWEPEEEKGEDCIHISINNQLLGKSIPIFDLGDGIQQIIILTYRAYLTREPTLFFIEEPELHMHAGMLRQLMNFYLNETEHYYFFTTHSNHLLDMADESDEVMIQKFVKQPKTDNPQESEFKIYRCGRDRDLLVSLGVKPSSVYLANCTIWVEGITDRLYIIKYMQKYLDQLKNQEPKKYAKYLRFMPSYHYAFVEYSGGNIVHWNFSDDYTDGLKDKGLSAKAVASDMLLIADGDNREKAERINTLSSELGTYDLYLLPCKEIENTLPYDAIISAAKSRFSRMKTDTRDGFDISKLEELKDRNYFANNKKGIGFLLDQKIKLPTTDKAKKVFDASAGENGVGTLKDKLKFCREVIKYFDENQNWGLTDNAKELCEKIYQHIERCNARRC